MTKNSKTRAAEQKVLDVARTLVYDQWKTYPGYGLERELIEAVQDLEALGLELPGDARSSARHPLTSDQAALWMRGARAKSAAARIVRLIHRGGPMTVDEMQVNLGMKHQTCSPRVTELRNSGWLVDSGVKRKTSSGEQAISWALSGRARQLLAAESGWRE